MSDAKVLSAAFSLPDNVSVREVGHDLMTPVAVTPAPLGPLVAFTGNWIGGGLNTIFRPNSQRTPTPFLVPPIGPEEAVLELNLTTESLSFAPSLGNITNRGVDTQGDIVLNGVPYQQFINDVTTLPSRSIHFEPGIWLSVPATTTPKAGVTLARMASIPHGTTISAQGTFESTAGKPLIAAVDITPFEPCTGERAPPFAFPSLVATKNNTFRLPQDLAPFIAAGTITQAMLTDPNTLLRNQIANQTISETICINISTAPTAPLFGGGVADIAFLLGVNPPSADAVGPNAQTVLMRATFWIETVVYQIEVPPMGAGDAPLVLGPVQTNPPIPLVPRFLVSAPHVECKRFAGGTITMFTPQIQYSQEVILNFSGKSWPHVSVASLVPADPISVPASLLPLT